MADNLSELDDCISDVLKKFQLVSGLQFKLRQEQVIAVKTLLSNRDVFAVLPTGYGKSLIFQCFVVAKELLEAKSGHGTPKSPCALVICPLTGIILLSGLRSGGETDVGRQRLNLSSLESLFSLSELIKALETKENNW